MLADECPERNALAPKEGTHAPMGVHLYMKDVDAVVERATAAGAKIVRQTENMFYGDRSAALVDPFGHAWYVATHIEDVTPSEMKKRMAALNPSSSQNS